MEQVTGEVSWGRYSGRVDYQFYRDEAGDTVLQGPFALRSAGLEASPFGTQPYISFQGYFQAGRPDSNWRFEFGDFDAVRDFRWVDQHVEVPVRGRLHTVEAPFSAGQAQGNWIHRIERIEGSGPIDTVLRSRLSVAAGRPTGNFRLEDAHLILLGRFGEQGLAHDVWTFNYKETVDKLEHWSWVNGRLTTIGFEREAGEDSLPVYPAALSRAQTVELNQRYLRILRLQGRLDSAAYAQLGGRGRALLLTHAALRARMDTALAALSPVDSPSRSPGLRVKVAHYPLTAGEARQLDTIRVGLQAIDSTAKRLLVNTRLSLLARTDEAVAFYRAVIQQIAGPYLAAARQLLTYESEAVLEFLPRSRLRPAAAEQDSTWPAIAVVPRDTAPAEPRRFEGPSVAYPRDTSALAYLVGLCQYGQAALDSIERALDQQLDRQAFQAELESLEKDLLRETDALDSLADSLVQVLPAAYAPALLAIKALAEQRLRQYSDEPRLKTKLTLAQASITCTQQLRQLARTLATLPSRWASLQQLYTEEVWNPFTATTMEDQVKERITQAYDELIIPYLLDEIEHHLRCEQVEAQIATLDALYQRMQQLRTEKTSQLERKLRRPPDPETVLGWFELSL